jgi:hypothetical protein
MTPQERRMIEELFDRLASLENTERDADAVDAINAGLDRAPNALYPLVQTVLVQDEALKRADARIRELEGELGIGPDEPPRQKSFLEGMRDDLTGKREQQGSVPSVRPGQLASPSGSKWGSGTTLPADYPQRGYQQGANPPQQAQVSGGGSFLGTAAATAAGVVGGALLMNSFRGMFGGEQSGRASAFDQGGGDSPWASGGGGDLARQAGLDDIGRGGGRSAAYDDSQRAGLFDVAQNDAGDSDLDSDFGGDFDGGGGDV